MHLHNFHVDYRNFLLDPRKETDLENEIFHYDQIDNTIICNAVTFDSNRPAGRPSNSEILCRMNGVMLRDHLNQLLQRHNMH